MDAYRSVDLMADEILESWDGAINPDDLERLARDYEEFAPLSALGEEFELARAYLALFQVRMGPRLRFVMELPPALRGLRFPPMVLATLAENAIKHGLAPADRGGTVQLTARRVEIMLEVSVVDDGVGFGTDTGGHGVGLANTKAARTGGGVRTVAAADSPRRLGAARAVA